MGLPGRDGWFRGARNRGFPHQIPPFYGPEMADFGRFPGLRISDAPPTYSPVLMYLEIQFLATSVSKFPHFDGPRFMRRGRPDLSADRKARFRAPGSADRGLPHQIPPFYAPEMAGFGRFPGFRISDAPPTYSAVLMYLEIQVLRGFPELEITTSARKFRRFGVPGNPNIGDF